MWIVAKQIAQPKPKQNKANGLESPKKPILSTSLSLSTLYSSE